MHIPQCARPSRPQSSLTTAQGFQVSYRFISARSRSLFRVCKLSTHHTPSLVCSKRPGLEFEPRLFRASLSVSSQTAHPTCLAHPRSALLPEANVQSLPSNNPWFPEALVVIYTSALSHIRPLFPPSLDTDILFFASYLAGRVELRLDSFSSGRRLLFSHVHV